MNDDGDYPESMWLMEHIKHKSFEPWCDERSQYLKKIGVAHERVRSRAFAKEYQDCMKKLGLDKYDMSLPREIEETKSYKKLIQNNPYDHDAIYIY